MNRIRKSLILAVAALPLSLPLGAGAEPVIAPPAAVLDQPSQQDAPPPLAPDAQPAQPAKAPDAQPAQPAKVPASVSAGALTIEQVGEILRNMGYDPKPNKNTSGGTFYTLAFERGAWTFSLTLSVSADGTSVWLSTPLTQLPEASQVSVPGLLKLLEQNYNIGPAFFSYRSEQNNRIYLLVPIANRDLTPAVLRARLDDFLSTIQDTHPLWDKKVLVVNNDATSAPAKPATADTR